MKAFTNWMTSPWAESLSWALLHSLWQSLAIMIIIMTLFRFLPKRDSGTRYVIAASGLFAMFISAVSTFLYLLLTTDAKNEATTAVINSSHHIVSSGVSSPGFLDFLITSIQQHIHWMTVCWMIGTLVFTLRLAGSWWYVSTLRTHAATIKGQWYQRVTALSQELNLRFIPELAESARVTAPVVIGYLKPVILLPVGMISGLTTAQIEAILLHELTHIKRHDYLVNILQALIEAVMFFNPFVWIASSIIRKEREHCCDDMVIRYSNPRTYATALAQLEEMKLTKSGLALSLAENKNQLLNRIKRIMENSVKNYSSREKLIPVLLLITGLVCASWITLQSQDLPKKDQSKQEETKVVPADTTRKKSSTRTFRYKSVTTVGEDGKPKEEIVQYYDSDNDKDFKFEMPSVPEVNFVPPVPPFPPADRMAPAEAFEFVMPPVPPSTWDAKEWEAFGKEFEVQFKENFSNFYEEHKEEFENMMKEVEVNLQENFNTEWTQEIAMLQRQEAMEHQREAMEFQREAMQEMQRSMQIRQEEHGQQMKALEAKLKKMEENMQRFEKALLEELTRDGYLKDGEKIDHICWKDDGTVEINDIKIKESDLPKYQKLHDKYFEHDDGEFLYVK